MGAHRSSGDLSMVVVVVVVHPTEASSMEVSIIILRSRPPVGDNCLRHGLNRGAKDAPAGWSRPLRGLYAMLSAIMRLG